MAKASRDDHRVLLVDLPNHGRSAWTATFDYLAWPTGRDPAVTDDPVALVGHSMGGKVAMVVALRHPELVERLCVVDVHRSATSTRSEFAGYVRLCAAST